MIVLLKLNYPNRWSNISFVRFFGSEQMTRSIIVKLKISILIEYAEFKNKIQVP